MEDNAKTLEWLCDTGKEDWKRPNAFIHEHFISFLDIRAIW